MITFDRKPDDYRHWRLEVDGPVATLTLDVDEDAGLVGGYKLKLNSYDLGVDIELHDALQRVRFEHPQVGCIVLTSGKDRMFCAGANIYMLGASTHAWKVNFCKFTNETRNGMEDSSRHDRLKFVAALNGVTAGGGYEVALACDEILMIDDRSSAVSLPEVPLLGVLPGTGGLTRVVDKRKVRRDLADLFCTSSDGVRAERAKAWGLVDAIAAPNAFPELVRDRALALADGGRGPAAEGVRLDPIDRASDEGGYRYRHLTVAFDRPGRTAVITAKAPGGRQPKTLEDILAEGQHWWPLAFARELDDAILMVRTNQLDLGLIVFRTEGEAAGALAAGASLLAHRDHWFVRETIGLLRRTLARLDVTSRSLYALVDRESCFAGLLLELALAADRSYMLAVLEDGSEGPRIVLDETNFGLFPMVNGEARLSNRYRGDPAAMDRVRSLLGKPIEAEAAVEVGLVTIAPDDLDWDDEIRLALEERASLSPDALTGLEASLRFAGPETVETKIFGRLSAWQNWVFYRPNATGERGALKTFGTGTKPQFDWERI